MSAELNVQFEISGKLQSGKFELAGNISSQYITGLMLALPLLKRNSTIELTSKLKSSSYIDITISTLLTGGIAKGFHDHRIVIAAAIAGVKCRSEVITRTFSGITKF